MANKRGKHKTKTKTEPTPVETALRPVGLDRQEVSEAFLAESLRPLDEDEIEAFYRPELLND